jgi:hypothetical protein
MLIRRDAQKKAVTNPFPGHQSWCPDKWIRSTLNLRRSDNMKWQKKLNKKEMKHLKDTHEGTPTLKAFKATREWHLKNRVDCIECRHIALKLGIEEA